MQKPSFYAVIPANVRYCAEIEPGAKLLFGEITALCNAQGFCWASNAYFADLYSCSNDTITRWVKSLSTQGFIRLEFDREAGNIRRIYISDPIRKNAAPIRKNTDRVSAKMPRPYPQKCQDNSNEFNITLNNNSAKAPDSLSQKTKNENSAKENSGLVPEVSAGPRAAAASPVFVADGWKEPEIATKAVIDWLEYKATEKRFIYRTQKALDAAVAEWRAISGNSGAELAKIVSQSIRNGWSGLFPIKATEYPSQQKKSAVNDISMEPEEYKREQLF